ncbi:MAG: hypothetical protein IPL40_03425 [Proteobacteria bacterium]|nr:hypothetical protein [Pseudomonadota bacterium]
MPSRSHSPRVVARALLLLLVVGGAASARVHGAAAAPRDAVLEPVADEAPRAAPPTPEPPPRASPAIVALFELGREGAIDCWAWLRQRLPGALVWPVLTAPLWVGLLVLGLLRVVRARRRGGAVRGAGLAGRMPAAPNEEAGPTPAAAPDAAIELAPPPELSRLEQLLLAPDGAQPSLHETLVVLGARAEVMVALHEQAAQLLDGPRWAALAAEGRSEHLRPLRARWIAAVATDRVVQWLATQPSVAQPRLQVSRPARFEVAEVVNLGLTQANGLGVTLKPEQRALLQQAQQALSLVYERPGDPYVLIAAAERSGVGGLRALPAGVVNEGSALSLPLLLHGMAALTHASGAGLIDLAVGRELATALKEHQRVVGAPVANEGSAAHALERTRGAAAEGIGTFLAAVAGAAYSPAAVVMRLSKLAGERPDPTRQLALGRLGDRVAVALRDASEGSGAAIYANLGRVLGLELVRVHGAELAEIERTTKTLALRQPLWGKEGRGATPPDLALLQLHRKRIDQQEQQVVAAQQLGWAILQQLAYTGKAGDNLANAQRRLGYAIAGFGAELVRGCDLEVVSAAREVLAGAAEARGLA